jgi:uncharacterized protein involved in exopolysaccharide biosynthesis
MDAASTKSIDNEEYADISLVGLSRVVRRQKYLVMSFFAFCLTVSVLVAFLSTPVYQSSIIISPVSSGSGGMIPASIGRLLQGFGGGMSAGGSSRNSTVFSLSALSSPYFVRAFIQDRDLLPVLFADSWDPAAKQWKNEDPAEAPTLSDAYDVFTKKVVEVDQDLRGGIVTITVNWKDPVLAAEWANGLVANANERLRSQAIQDADLTIKYLNQELASTNALELQQAIYFLVESEIQKRTIAKVQSEYAFKVLSPAVPADWDKYDSPNRALIISIGLVLGLMGGVFLAILAVPIGKIVKDLNENG